jgi:hypothetical protein
MPGQRITWWSLLQQTEMPCHLLLLLLLCRYHWLLLLLLLSHHPSLLSLSACTILKNLRTPQHTRPVSLTKQQPSAYSTHSRQVTHHLVVPASAAWPEMVSASPGGPCFSSLASDALPSDAAASSTPPVLLFAEPISTHKRGFHPTAQDHSVQPKQQASAHTTGQRITWWSLLQQLGQ